MKSNMHFGVSITVLTTEKYRVYLACFLYPNKPWLVPRHTAVRKMRFPAKNTNSQDIVSLIHVQERYVRARLFTRGNMKWNKVCESRKKSGTQWCSAMFCSNKKENKNLSFFRFPTDPERWDSNRRLYSSFR